MILSGEIPPGAVVSQLQMAKVLGVSTTPLREAMRQLQSEGLLEAELNRRPRVPKLDVDDLHAVYAGRILLESLAISLTVSTIDDETIQAMQDDLLEMQREAETRSLKRWEHVHARFHRRLIAGVTPDMTSALSNFFDRAERYRRLSVLSDEPRGWTAAAQEHERIVAACRAGDHRAASVELATHLARTAIMLSAAFAPEVDPTPVRHALSLISGTDQRRTGSQNRP